MRVIRSKSQRWRYWRYLQQRRLLLWLNLGFLFILGTGIVGAVTESSWAWIPLVLGFILLAGPFLTNLRGEVWLFQAGWRGERAVTESLRGHLDDAFVLLNGFVLKGQSGDIDHVLIGPTGVFAIETKNHSGYVRCESDTWVRKPSRSARRYRQVTLRSPAKAVLQDTAAVLALLEKFGLDITVTPIVVFSNPDVVLSLKRPLVRVLALSELLPQITAAKTCLTGPEIDKVVSILTGQIAGHGGV